MHILYDQVALGRRLGSPGPIFVAKIADPYIIVGCQVTDIPTALNNEYEAALGYKKRLQRAELNMISSDLSTFNRIQRSRNFTQCAMARSLRFFL